MKIEKFYLNAFGPFTEEILDLKHSPFTIIYGRNEAGKSSSLRALISFFFGIEERSSDNFIHDHRKLRIGAELAYGDGTNETVYRRKGRTKTLLNEQDSVIGSAVFEEIFRGLQREEFENAWGLNHTRLKTGADSLLSDGGELGSALLSARTGKDIHELRLKLKGLASGIYKKHKSSKTPLNKAIQKQTDLMKQFRASINHQGKYEKLVRDLKKLEEEKDAKYLEMKRDQEELILLNKVSDVFADYQLYKAMLSSSEKYAKVRILREDFGVSKTRLFEQRKGFKDLIEQLENSISETESAIKSCLQDKTVLEEQGEKLSEFVRLFTKISEEPEKLEQEKSKINSLQNEIKDFPAQIGLTESEMISLAEEIYLYGFPNINVLIDRWKTELLNQNSLKTRIDEERAEAKSIKDRLSKLVIPAEFKSLALELESAAKLAETEEWLLKENGPSEQERSFHIDLSESGLPRLTPEEFLQLHFPAEKVIKEKQKELIHLQELLRDKGKDLNGLRSDIENYENEQGAEEEFEYDIADLRMSRKARDHEFTRAIASQEFSSFEKRLEHVDEITDYLLLHIQAKTLASSMAGKLESRRARLISKSEEITGTRVKFNSLNKEWEEFWSGLEIRIPEPKDADSYILRIRQLTQLAQRVQDEQVSNSRRLNQIDEMTNRLKRFLPGSQQSYTMLEEVVFLCKALYDEWDEEVNLKKSLERDLDGRKSKIAKLEPQLNECIIKVSKLRGQLEALLGKQICERDPHEVLFSIDILETFRNTKKLLKEDEESLGEMQGQREKCQSIMALLVSSITNAPNTEIIEVGGPYFKNLLETCKQSITRLEEADKSLQKDEGKLKAARENNQKILGEWETLLIEAGVKDEAELGRVQRLSSEVRQWKQSVENYRNLLATIKPGSAFDEIENLFNSYTKEKIALKIENLNQKQKDLGEERDELIKGMKELEDQKRLMEESSNAAKDEFLIEENSVEMFTLAEDYIHFKVAELLLHKMIESFTSENMHPILKLSQRYFRDLTLGAYEKFDLETADDGRILLNCVSADEKYVDVKGLSDGTRDQLYFALRLGSIETALKEQKEPLPFLADDIFINFDDDRTAAGLRALENLSKSTQVILWTHHERLKDLAPQNCRIIDL
jgi:uncharacterized protein YhaN